MFLFLTRYFKILAALLLAMGLYKVTVVPAIEPEAVEQKAVPDYSPMASVSRWWIDFFPEGGWQTENPQIINTERGILLSQNWTPLDEKTWRLEPLTMILPHSKSARAAIADRNNEELQAEEMWIVSAEKGATIHFQDPVDITSGTKPVVVRGDLEGKIEVTRRALNDSVKDNWRITAYDMRIDRRKLETDQKVKIEWNNSIIEGRELKILLRGDLLGSQGSDSSNWGPLEELELYNVDRVDIALPPGGIWADMSLEKLDENPHLRTLPARVEATCRGRFTFNFGRSQASLQNNVRLLHRLGDLPPDEFTCERVMFELEPPKESMTSSTSDASSLKVKMLEATGVDALREMTNAKREVIGEKWVNIVSPTVGLSVKSKHLKMQLDRNRIELAGRINQPNATQSAVIVNYLGNEIRAPDIHYQAAPRDVPEDQKHLGWLVATGPGELRTANNRSSKRTEIRWKDTFRMKPSPHSPQVQWIELAGNTFVDSKSLGFLTSERLEIWLRKLDNAANSLPQPDSITGQFQPERIYATGTTVAETPKLRLEVDDGLDLAFAYAPPSAAKTSAQNEPKLPLSDSQGNPMFQWMGPPDNEASQANSATDSSEEEPSNPIKVSGRNLQASIVSANKQQWVDHLQMEGPVEIQKPDEKTGKNSWKIEGTQLVLTTDKAGNADVQIDGAPAQIHLADGLLKGKTIRVDQAQNLVWMNDPGEFTVPLGALNRQDSSVKWFKAPFCKWNGRMQFDGQVCEIRGDIEYEGGFQTSPNAGPGTLTSTGRPSEPSFWWLVGRSNVLRVKLDEKLDMEGGADTQNAQIDRIELEEQVNLLASETDRQGNIQSREQINVPLLTIHTADNQIVGTGPGWVKSNYLDGGFSDRASGRQLAVGSAPKLQGMHLRFRDSLVGFFERREVVFDGKVEVGVSPISTWDHQVDLEDLNELRIDQMLMNCDQLKLYDTARVNQLYNQASLTPTQSSREWEIKATGNVAFNGMSDSGAFDGTAYQITYFQVKDFLLIKGDGRTPAYLSRDTSKLTRSKQMPGQAELYVHQLGIYPKTFDIEGLQPAEAGATFTPAQGLRPSGSQQETPRVFDPRKRSSDFYNSNSGLRGQPR